MFKKPGITLSFLLIVFVAFSQNKSVNDRQLWLRHLDKMARPVMMHLAEDRLKEKMRVMWPAEQPFLTWKHLEEH